VWVVYWVSQKMTAAVVIEMLSLLVEPILSRNMLCNKILSCQKCPQAQRFLAMSSLKCKLARLQKLPGITHMFVQQQVHEQTLIYAPCQHWNVPVHPSWCRQLH
jgi:hypothetical protein